MALLLSIALAVAGAPAPAAALPAPPPATVQAPVLARTIEKGELMSAADFETAPLAPNAARGALPPAAAAGKEAARRLMAGAIVKGTDIVMPRLVRRGEAVTIAVVSGGLTITAPGRALTDGGKGDAVRVVSLSTNRTLDAVVDQPGRVRIAGQ
ncbi:flagellar basal body P-ring biosynthesis protein FlgA [Sphingomonas sp. MM-1]|uniref:flagellar basal body P-ring formation chaperone FlgA n=1 Tax=Sphingomonas sp. MM-1 TaxID=745310 RepID=UPI0002C0CBF1|nr:flagellar basal body P-ring formation chaperone FlgA [Sphingomonas sp. MM-1]AGH49093.1 flagellar basal body P-ring biosynthesis protein FlgA [Sphingomonas sp. MM-1]